MSWPLVQVGILVAMTHAVRAVGDRLGPRWGALVLGMPSTTAVLLVGGGCEGGTPFAARAAEAGLLGLVATVALPLAYALAIRVGGGVPAAPIAAVLAYLVAATVLLGLPDLGPFGSTFGAIAGVSAACWAAGRLPRAESGGGYGARQRARSFWLRTAVPAAFVLANRALRAWAGPGAAGAFATFPAMSLAVLVSLHLEGGRVPALRMARSMPRGNVLMVAFLVAFRASCESLGPFGGAAVGYAAVLGAMVTLVRLGRPRRAATIPRRVVYGQYRPTRGLRRFAPRIEPIFA